MAIPKLELIYGEANEGVGTGNNKYMTNIANNIISKGETEFNDGNFIILCWENKNV